jgi:hypothetical protein
MNNPDDCPEKSNNVVAALADGAEIERLSKKALLSQRAIIMSDWKTETLPAALAANAERLHGHNKRAIREVGAGIDEHRQTPEGRAAYNAKRRLRYMNDQDGEVREYARGLSAEDRAERDRTKNAEAQAKSRSKKTTTQQSAERAERRRKQKAREAEAAELEAIAVEATRRTF